MLLKLTVTAIYERFPGDAGRVVRMTSDTPLKPAIGQPPDVPIVYQYYEFLCETAETWSEFRIGQLFEFEIEDEPPPETSMSWLPEAAPVP